MLRVCPPHHHSASCKLDPCSAASSHPLLQVDSQAAQLSKMRISWEEFVSIDHLQEHLHELKVALECMDKVRNRQAKQAGGHAVGLYAVPHEEEQR